MMQCKIKFGISLTTACLVSIISIGAAVADIPSSRQHELLRLLKHDCGSCHGMTLRGGLGPALLPKFIEGKPKAYLVNTILQGRKGTPMPPWRQFMSEQEAAWLIEVLLKGKNNAR